MKRYILSFFVLLSTASLSATEPIQLRVYGNYEYSYTYLSQGGISAVADVPINPNFCLIAGARLLSNNAYTLSADIRPVFPLPVGKLYLSTRLLYTAAVTEQLHDAAASIGIGYEMDYIDVQFGLQSRLFAAFDASSHSAEQIVFEAPHLLYGIEVFVRPQSSSTWNMTLRFANYDDFQIERMWQPIFRLGGYYNINPAWRVLADLTCKPTGMFHLCASFHTLTARAGFAYNFNR